jgi:hypothetical protein
LRIGKHLALGGVVEALEGMPPKRVVISQWTSTEDIKRWPAAPAMRAVNKARQNLLNAWLFRLLVCGLVFLIWPSTISLAQIRLHAGSGADWTVLTMAPDGAWGAATDGYVNQAIATAIMRCRAKSARTLGCGAYMASIQNGWAVGLRCDGESILATGATLVEAATMARRREEQFRLHYQPTLANCRRVVSVSASGVVTEYGPGQLGSDLNAQR